MQTFSSFVIKADYFLNKNYIATVLCINKAKPKLQCSGKCYLAKKLKEEEKQQQTPNNRKEKFEVSPYFLPAAICINNTGLVSKTTFFFIEEHIVAIYTPAIFRPPIV